MVVQTRTNPRGPRFLTQRHLEKKIQSSDGNDPPRPPVAPGFMQLFSYYKPGLTAGNYAIFAEQFITSKKGSDVQSLRVANWKGTPTLPDNQPSEPQIFEVMAPQFSLDPKLVNSFYPPEGHQDEGRILPHIVLNDPHFPWERDADKAFSGGVDDDLKIARLRDPDVNAAGQTIDKNGKVTTDRHSMVYRSIVPWIRLMVFDVGELKLDTPQQAQALGVPDFADLSNPLADIKRQPASGAFSMTAKDYFNIKPDNRIDFESAYATDPDGFTEISTGRRSKESAQVIYPTKDTFYKLFRDIESNKYLSHVRNINTTNFPNAGVEENGIFSIVLSGRTGSFKAPRPVTQVVHLVSIENMYSTLQSRFQNWDTRSPDEKADRIGLISLFSWTYTSLPPNPINFIDTMTNIIGDNHDFDDSKQDLKLKPKPSRMQMLRPPDTLIDALAAKSDSQSKLLATRFKLGYSIARWRCETGEVTAAFSRGPLVPVQTPGVPVKDWPTGSQTGRNYQILDKTTGVMDLSYSSAWNLGKTLAISDTSFSAALLRFRSQIHTASASSARAQVNGLVSRVETIKSLLENMKRINSRLDDNVEPPRRVIAPSDKTVDTDLTNPDVAAAMATAVSTQVSKASQAGDEIFNEFNSIGENNTDWAIIMRWISDKLYLSDIPAHILFPDPTLIPEESIRFFYIDDAYMDCFIDGALSVGNHLESDNDRIRNTIKESYNLYLSTTVPAANMKPQIPCYGFVFRSQIVKVMPDLKINVNWNSVSDNPPDPRAPFCQWLRPDDHTLVCLLDRPPEELAPYNKYHPDLSGIVLSQPPHQQRFSFGHTYTPATNSFEFKLRHLYTENPLTGEWPGWDHSGTTPPNKPETAAASQIDLDSRVLKTTELAAAVNNGIQQQVGGDPDFPTSAYVDYVPNSAELALELNDPAYYFIIYPEQKYASQNRIQRVRQLYTAPDTITSATLTQKTTTLLPKVTSVPTGKPIPIHPPKADVSIPIIPVPQDVPRKAGKVTVRDHAVALATAAPSPPTQMPKKCFTMDVFVDYRGLRPRVNGVYDPGDYVPTQSKYLVDLIFNIRKGINRSDPGNDQMLREIAIHVPNTPDPSEATKTDALITKSWSGRARLLANQRFTTFVSRTATYLEIRLIPRSADINPVIKLNDNKTAEMVFVLTDVDVPPTVVKKFFTIKGQRQNVEMGFARVDVWERYQLDKEGLEVIAVPDTKKYFVLKKDTDN